MTSTEPVDPSARGTWRGKLLILALFAVFVVPIGLAWLFASGTIGLGTGGGSNRGDLITPALDLRGEGALQAVVDRAALAPSEWLMLYVSAGPCAAECVAQLKRLATIRSVLGYAGQRVRVLALTTTPTILEDADLRNRVLVDQSAFAALRKGLAARLDNNGFPQIVLIDWRQQAALRFAAEAASGDIKSDLQRLLRASRVR